MKKIPDRKSYDAPPAGYKRQTVYVQLEVFSQFVKIAKSNGESLKDALARAIKWYISHGH